MIDDRILLLVSLMLLHTQDDRILLIISLVLLHYVFLIARFDNKHYLYRHSTPWCKIFVNYPGIDYRTSELAECEGETLFWGPDNNERVLG